MSFTAATSSHPIAYIGPTYVSMFIQALETGFLLSLHLTFWRHNKEGKIIKYIIVYASIIGLLQTCFTAREMWYITVTGFGSWDRVFNWSWLISLSPLMTAWTGIPIQAFLSARCWMLWNQNSRLLTLLSFLTVVHAIIIIVATVQQCSNVLWGLQKLKTADNNALNLPLDSSILACLIGAAVVNVTLSFLLLTGLVRSRSATIRPQLQMMLDFVGVLIWETAILPATCSVTATFLYGFMNNSSFWYRPFQTFLGKLYVITLLITLNNRIYISKDLNTEDAMSAGNQRPSLSTRPCIATNIMTIVHPSAHTRHVTYPSRSDSSQDLESKEGGGPQNLSTLNFASLSEIHSGEDMTGVHRISITREQREEDQSSFSVCACGRSDCSYLLPRQSCHSSRTQVDSDGNPISEAEIHVSGPMRDSISMESAE